jgi:hypothetical protein
VVAAAMLLEEPRMEAARVRRRPEDCHRFARVQHRRRADLHLLSGTSTDPATAPQTTPARRAHRPVAGTSRRRRAHPEVPDKLRTALRTAARRETMLDLGRQWREILGTDQDTDPNTPAVLALRGCPTRPAPRPVR